jgi:cysteine desulfurase/selenocysteine lyase
MLDADHAVCVRPGLHCAPDVHELLGTVSQKGTVRFAPGYFTDEEDIHQAIAAVEDLASA